MPTTLHSVVISPTRRSSEVLRHAVAESHTGLGFQVLGRGGRAEPGNPLQTQGRHTVLQHASSPANQMAANQVRNGSCGRRGIVTEV